MLRNMIATLVLSLALTTALSAADKPNLILIFVDDLGYSDIGPFGSELHRTPHLDRMAAEGRKLTGFYVTANVCTPSRSSLMTGSYPPRVSQAFNHLRARRERGRSLGAFSGE